MAIVIRYKRAEWHDWCFWTCQTETEAAKVRHWLQKEGYEIQG